ncbi:MAG: isochorismate synthase [Acidobacteriota bacterium]
MVEKKIPLSGLKKAVKEEISLYIEKNISEKFIRIEFRTELLDPLLWLKIQPNTEKIYFESRGKGAPEVACAGCALRVVPGKDEDLASYFKKLNRNIIDGQKFYGGVSFFKDLPDKKEWASFGHFNFILPRFEYSVREKKGFFTVNLAAAELTEKKIVPVLRDVKDIKFDVPEKHDKAGRSEIVKCTPDKKEWIAGISSYLKKIKKGEIQKIVPARRLELKNTGKTDPFRVMYELKRAGDYTANFLMTFNGEEYFAGSTPERLFHRDGDLLTTESLAGTAPRGNNSNDDESFGKKLLESKKETLEHDFVTNEIVNKIDPVCELVAISERVLLKLANLQHLYRRISGKLKKNISDGEILEKMFPTPAVSGLPRDKCQKILLNKEPFQRGWYAGVVGFAGKDVSDYYVGIRSVLMNRERIYIYSGAGIVEGSDPGKEWEEIDLKIKKYKKILKYET